MVVPIMIKCEIQAYRPLKQPPLALKIFMASKHVPLGPYPSLGPHPLSHHHRRRLYKDMRQLRAKFRVPIRSHGMAFALAAHLLHRAPRPSIHLCLFPRVSILGRQKLPVMPAAQSLDRASFTEQWALFALKVPSKLCQGTRKALKSHMLAVPRLRSVVPAAEVEILNNGKGRSTVLLLKYLAKEVMGVYANGPKEHVERGMIGKDVGEVGKVLREIQVGVNIDGEVLDFVTGIGEADLVEREVKVGYEHWGADDVLKSLLSKEVVAPASFETVGHIVHLNLRDEHEEWKGVIGEVFLDKLGSRIRTVVNKLESTGGPYRTFKMEVLAGERDFVTMVKENGCLFELDFEKVYWNSRLEAEHKRIVQSLDKGDILADAFCGVGPFTIPAARRGRCARVFANDLNPSSVEYLKRNAKRNKVESDRFETSCGCAKTFLRKVVREEGVGITKVVMNFPSGAPEFLDVFRGLYRGKEDLPLPKVHCYCFVKGIDDMDSARRRVRKALFGEEGHEMAEKSLPDSAIEVRDVRDVAPRKRQVCVTFQLPEAVAFLDTANIEEKMAHAPPSKKARVDS